MDSGATLALKPMMDTSSATSSCMHAHTPCQAPLPDSLLVSAFITSALKVLMHKTTSVYKHVLKWQQVF